MSKRFEQTHRIRQTVVNKHVKKYSTSLVTKEIYVKATIRQQYTAIQMDHTHKHTEQNKNNNNNNSKYL